MDYDDIEQCDFCGAYFMPEESEDDEPQRYCPACDSELGERD